MAEDHTKDEFAAFFDWKNIVDGDSFLANVEESKLDKDNAQELSKRLSLSKKSVEADTQDKDEKPTLHKGLHYFLKNINCIKIATNILESQGSLLLIISVEIKNLHTC